MGSGNSTGKEAEVSSQKKLDDDLDRIQDAETIRLKLNGPDGTLYFNARLNGPLREFKEKVAAELGVTKEYAEYLETHLSGYQLEPATKNIRDFTELCEDCEIDIQGVEKAEEAMVVIKQQAAMKVNVHTAAKRGNMAELELVAEYASERMNETNSYGYTPLHMAAGNGREAAVRVLLAGANVNKTDNRGKTPLSFAANVRVKQLLRDAGGRE